MMLQWASGPANEGLAGLTPLPVETIPILNDPAQSGEK